MKDVLHDDLIEEVASRLDLREPNKRALQALAYDLDHYFDVEGLEGPREVVIDAATGMGKTYILAGAIEYLARLGTRNFVVITPGRTILEKTLANFTPGHPKSLLGGMEVEPVLITAENFTNASLRAEMDDESKVKLFVFTAQSLLRPTTKAGRRTRKHHEVLGRPLYDHLDGLDDLVVFADEHHVYHGPKFSDAVRGLTPRALIGLTATPDEKALTKAGIPIVFRYPLAAAIAEGYVKTPVIVGRKDDLSDARTKIADGLRLLRAKEQAIEAYCDQTGAERVVPVMLIVAQTIEDADEYERLLNDPSFMNGEWGGDKVLTVHSDVPDEALAALEKVEEPESPVRVIISVGMLKEGWDVKNVYVIASMRASISDVLTEQTLGRGLRLPWGAYTGVGLLDTLEVVAHERYDELLRRAKVINERFIDHETRLVEKTTESGEAVPALEEQEVSLEVIPSAGESGDPTAEQDAGDPAMAPGGAATGADGKGLPAGTPTIGSVEERHEEAEAEAAAARQVLVIRDGSPTIQLPVMRLQKVESRWSLNDITDLEAFRRLGRRISLNPETELRRTRISARVITGRDGLRRTELVTETPEERIEAEPMPMPLEEAKKRLRRDLLSSPAVPAHSAERAGAARIVDAFIEGLGEQAEQILSSYIERASGQLIAAVNEAQRAAAGQASFEREVETRTFAATRMARARTSADRMGEFAQGVGYEGYSKSLFEQDWFDSRPERDIANILDAEDAITAWLRLQRGDLKIEWEDGTYNPDFVAVDRDGVHWIIEVKADSAMSDAVVQAKRDAAKRWANHVNASDAVKDEWRYLLVSESDIKRAKGSWAALRSLGP